jgi:hypothetical protein
MAIIIAYKLTREILLSEKKKSNNKDLFTSCYENEIMCNADLRISF